MESALAEAGLLGLCFPVLLSWSKTCLLLELPLLSSAEDRG